MPMIVFFLCGSFSLQAIASRQRVLAGVPIPAEMLKSIRAERRRLTRSSKEVVEEEEYQLDDVNVDLSMVSITLL